MLKLILVSDNGTVIDSWQTDDQGGRFIFADLLESLREANGTADNPLNSAIANIELELDQYA